MTEIANAIALRKLCKTSSHQWGEWEYVAANSCTEQSVCSRCNSTRLRFSTHQWSEWEYVSEDLCDQKKFCARCGENYADKRVEHNWSNWEYMSENHCDQNRSCSRCGGQDTDVLHVWGNWEYVSGDLCDQKKSCLRCGEIHNDVRVVHAVWVFDREENETTTGYEKGPGASYDAEIYEAETTWTTVYHKCSRCGVEKVADTYHSSTRID